MSTREDAIVKWFASRSDSSRQDFPIGIGDDMAQVYLGADKSVLVTTDILSDGVHFDLKKTGLEQVGYKAIAVSLSDCAAMASVPVGAVVSVVMPRGYGKKELKELHNGIVKSAKKFGCQLIGGDITCWRGDGPFVINVAMLSRPAGGKPIERSGAKVGDYICVTGELGGSDAGRHLSFEPRVKEAIQISRMAHINSMIDISDGLSSDLNRICSSSGVGAIIEAKRIPISQAAQQKKKPLASALNDGEDFELLFTLPGKECEGLLSRWKGEIGLTRIGQITDRCKMQIKLRDGRLNELKIEGYDHLS